MLQVDCSFIVEEGRNQRNPLPSVDVHQRLGLSVPADPVLFPAVLMMGSPISTDSPRFLIS